MPIYIQSILYILLTARFIYFVWIKYLRAVTGPSVKCFRIFKAPLAKSVVFARYSLRGIEYNRQTQHTGRTDRQESVNFTRYNNYSYIKYCA